jgi:hypothetical protein
MKNGEKYARKCSITGEGMNEGFCFEGGHMYAKGQAQAEYIAAAHYNRSLLDLYEANLYYYTEWEDKDDYQYIIKDGKLLEIDEVISEDTMEFVEATGDMESETWRHKGTGQMYNVPVQLIRDFDNATVPGISEEQKRKQLAEEKKRVIDDLNNHMLEFIDDSGKLTGDMLRSLKQKIEDLIISDF